MAGINATVTTSQGLENSEQPQPRRGRPRQEGAEEPKVRGRRRKSQADQRDLDNCGFCKEKLTAFVAADGWRFCGDDCVKGYLT